MLQDFSRQDVIEVFEKLEKESDEFEAAKTTNQQAVFGVIIVWIGLYARAS